MKPNELNLEIPWKSAPFVRLVPALAAGITLGFYVNTPYIYTKVALAMVVFLYFILVFIVKKNNKKTQYAVAITINMACLLLGYELLIAHTPTHRPQYFGKQLSHARTLLVRIADPPQQKKRSYKVVAQIQSITDTNYHTHTANGRILIHLKKTAAAAALEYGDFLIIPTQDIDAIPPPPNRFAFDYRHYLRAHGVHHQVFLDSASWRRVGTTPSYNLFKISYSLQQKFVETIAQHIADANHAALISALVIGYRTDLSPEITQAYSDTGTIHVLSVSGLHVGIIYWLLQLIFNTILPKNNQKTRIIKATSIILGLIAFTFITGLVPCVCRAAFMFSLVVMGGAFARRISMYNSLAATFFILLCFNPYYIVDIGFQLSYLAILGIVFLHSKMFNLFYFKNKTLRQIWNLTCVSATAQLATLPLTIHFFHQFPNHFWFANLLVIPLASLMLFLGIGLMVVSKIPFAAYIVAQITTYTLMFNDWLMYTLQRLPLAVTQGLFITRLQMWLWFVLIIALLLAIIYKYKRWAATAAVAIAAVATLQAIEIYTARTHQNLIVQSTQRLSLTILHHQQHATLLTHDSLPPSINALQYSGTKNYLNANHIQKFSFAQWQNRQHITTIRNKKILHLCRSNKNWQYSNTPFFIDVLIVSQNTWLDTTRIKNIFAPKIIVIDGSNSKSYADRTQRLLQNAGLRTHNTHTQGDFYLFSDPKNG